MTESFGVELVDSLGVVVVIAIEKQDLTHKKVASYLLEYIRDKESH